MISNAPVYYFLIVLTFQHGGTFYQATRFETQEGCQAALSFVNGSQVKATCVKDAQ
jgi:hypothetical protein